MVHVISTVLIFTILITIYHYADRIGDYIQDRARSWIGCPDCRARKAAASESAPVQVEDKPAA